MMSKFLGASVVALAMVPAQAGAATPDGPATIRHNPYRTDKGQAMDLLPPGPHRTISETFEY